MHIQNILAYCILHNGNKSEIKTFQKIEIMDGHIKYNIENIFYFHNMLFTKYSLPNKHFINTFIFSLATYTMYISMTYTMKLYIMKSKKH